MRDTARSCQSNHGMVWLGMTFESFWLYSHHLTQEHHRNHTRLQAARSPLESRKVSMQGLSGHKLHAFSASSASANAAAVEMGGTCN
jgi:hypothetical protein